MGAWIPGRQGSSGLQSPSRSSSRAGTRNRRKPYPGAAIRPRGIAVVNEGK